MSAESERHAAAARAWLTRSHGTGFTMAGVEGDIVSLASLLAETAAAARREQREHDAEIAETMLHAPELATDEDSPWASDPGFVAVTNRCARTFAEVCARAIRASDAAETSP